jgi:hypothetical protein
MRSAFCAFGYERLASVSLRKAAIPCSPEFDGGDHLAHGGKRFPVFGGLCFERGDACGRLSGLGTTRLTFGVEGLAEASVGAPLHGVARPRRRDGSVMTLTDAKVQDGQRVAHGLRVDLPVFVGDMVVPKTGDMLFF